MKREDLVRHLMNDEKLTVEIDGKPAILGSSEAFSTAELTSDQCEVLLADPNALERYTIPLTDGMWDIVDLTDNEISIGLPLAYNLASAEKGSSLWFRIPKDDSLRSICRKIRRPLALLRNSQTPIDSTIGFRQGKLERIAFDEVGRIISVKGRKG
ncbi:hypothetical protein [Sanyastnella coralliicola]|uniref:hypothetical protein n=1 Tax=Sanyastnella coralliicola TaxID=3069118 RepID=UPI0027BA6765|nr:hypothetical protein [Longitalea sp. SCSIO 12813]